MSFFDTQRYKVRLVARTYVSYSVTLVLHIAIVLSTHSDHPHSRRRTPTYFDCTSLSLYVVCTRRPCTSTDISPTTTLCIATVFIRHLRRLYWSSMYIDGSSSYYFDRVRRPYFRRQCTLRRTPTYSDCSPLSLYVVCTRCPCTSTILGSTPSTAYVERTSSYINVQTCSCPISFSSITPLSCVVVDGRRTMKPEP
jgi:hypothetical protein